MRYRRQMKETWEIDFGNLLLHLILTCLATNTWPIYEFFRSLNSVIIERKRKSHPHHRRVCVTCKLEKQLFTVVSCIENYFPQTFAKSLGYYLLWRVMTVTLQVQLYLNYSSQWIFFFQYSGKLEIFFWKNCSERLMRQLVPVSM